MEQLYIRLKSHHKHELNHSSGSLFHGFLNHLLPKEMSERLHRKGLPLFHQKISYYIQTVEWTIFSFDKEIAEELKKRLTAMDEVFLTHKNLKLEIIEIRSVLNLPLEKWFLDIQKQNLTHRHVHLEFVSPTSHKVQGKYLKDFDLEVMCKHIIRKINLLQTRLYLNEDTINILMNNIKIMNKYTNQTVIHLKGQRIPAFEGTVHLKWVGNENSLTVYNLLWLFAELSGVGIKTAMGFGNIRVL